MIVPEVVGTVGCKHGVHLPFALGKVFPGPAEVAKSTFGARQRANRVLL